MKAFDLFVANPPLAINFHRCIRPIATLLALFLLTTNARAVNGPGTVATNGFPWVVALTFGGNGAGYLGSASYITNGVVLTAAHNINSENLVTAGNVTNSIGRTIDSVNIGGQQYFALGVQDPLYAGVSSDPNDIGLYLVLNAPAVPGGVFPTLAKPGSAPLTTGNTIQVLGFGKSAPGGLPIYGTMTLTNFAGDVTYNQYTFHQPPSLDLTDPGDSGGPYIFNNTIVAVHTTGITSPLGVKVGATGTRVDNHYGFVTGDGQTNGAAASPATLVRLNGTAPTTWSAVASWGRASTNFATIPQTDDIAILDPTTNSDAGTVVTLDVNTAALGGLLNDVTLNVNGHALNVTSTTGSAIGGNSGVLNGGKINVTGAASSVLNVSASLDNEGGTIAVGQNGQAFIGGALPTGYVTYNTALFNGSNGTVAVTAGGSMAVTNGDRMTQIINGDATSVISVKGDGTGAANIVADRVDSYGVVQVGQRGLLDLNNAFFNEFPAQLQISGGAAGNGTGDVFQLVNFGTVNVSTGGTLVADGVLNNFGPMTVAGGSILTTNFTLSSVQNIAANLQVTALAANTGRVTMTSGNIGVTNAAKNGQLLVNAGTFTMNGGNLNADQIVVTNGAMSQFSLNGGVVTSSYTRVSNGSTFYVGSNAVAASLVLIDSTHSFDNGLDIAVTSNSIASVFFGGTQLFATNNMIRVGVLGSGQMTVSNGTVTAGTLNGPVPVLVGALGGSQGTLTVVGGTLNSAGPLRIGDAAAATGTVWLTGGQLTTTNANTFIGSSGIGQLTMSNGLYLSEGLLVGYATGSQGTMVMAGGTNILSGAFPNLTAGNMAAATGTVLITGGSMVVTNGSTIIGNFGVGQLTISNTTMQARDVTIASQLGSVGTFTLNMGTLTTSGLLNNTNGFIKGVGTINGSVVNAGTISPGFSPGRIFVASNLTLQATSTLVMELGGTDTNLYDQIFVGQNLQMDGTLSVSLINSFDPALSNSFHIFDFASSGGEFSLTNLPALDPGLGWDTSDLMTDGDISVIAVAVPEPSTCVLVFGACAGLSLLRRKKKIVPPTVSVTRRQGGHRHAKPRFF
jgi:T5SS/PEP-CTERM-associated repeat protein